MKPFDGLHIFENTGTILAVNNYEESEDSGTDKAKRRVIVGRLDAVTGGRPTAQRWSKGGKPRILIDWDGRAAEVGVRKPGLRGFIRKVTRF
jgi:hypothetical protein